jgi:predicted hotdog family 3-hydroxylacyl-ACP dehydratase
MTAVTNILPLIPQRDPFVMIDTLKDCDDTSAKTSFTVKDENIFVKDGILGEPALIENIAQTAAARIGYICGKENKPVPVGFIGAVQQLEVLCLPRAGDVLETEISIKNQVFNATIISGNIRSGNKPLATCEMKIFINQ